jgi:hypothetical protein
MKALSLLLILSTFVACGKNGQDGASGSDGATIIGLDGVSTGVDFADIPPGLACAAGGISIFTFRDSNSDAHFSEGEEDIIKVRTLCHGTNGTNGVDGEDGQNGSNASLTLEIVVSSGTCPQGGVKMTSSQSAPVEVCNGVNGLNGEQGIPGVQGIPGLAGANGSDGTQILPVQFCPSDDSTLPEYGLMIGKDLFAVYWGTTPASPKTPQAFLTKLVPGNYQSSGGNNCLFSIE